LALNNTKGFSGMRIYFDENPTETFSVKDSKQVYFDASEYSNELGSDFWEYEVLTAGAHESQLSGLPELLSQTQRNNRKVILLEISDVKPNDERYMKCSN
jgi:hypothetical protein